MLKRKLSLLVLALSLVFTAARCYQYARCIDVVTGYNMQSAFNTGVIVFAAACCLFLIAPLLLPRSCFSVDTTRKGARVFFCAANLILCMTFAAAAVVGIGQYIAVGKHEYGEIALIICSILSVVYFSYIFIHGGMTPLHAAAHLLIVGPVGYSVTRLIVVFNQLTMNAHVSGYKYMLLGLGATILFFLMFGRYQMDGTAARGLYIAARLTVFLLSAASLGPFIVQLLPGAEFVENIPVICRFADLAVILYAWSVVCLIRIGDAGGRTPTPEADDNENIEN